MSAEILRRAAALMRERAEAAEPSPWSIDEGPGGQREVLGPIVRVPGKTEQVILSDTVNRPNAEHIASWHPAVALAMADLLDMHAQGIEDFNDHERFGDKGAPYPEAQPNDGFLTVARAYLGEQA